MRGEIPTPSPAYLPRSENNKYMSSSSPSTSPPIEPEQQDHHQRSRQQPQVPADRRYIAANQQALFQAYLHAIRTGQISMPDASTANTMAKGERRANHHHTISDAKRGVTYVGQEQLKPLPIPLLEETCQRYLESVRPFLVSNVRYISLISRLLESTKTRRVWFRIFRSGKARNYKGS